MTRTTRITFIVAGGIGLVLGIAAGCQHAELASGAMQYAATMAASSVTADFALQQFEHADNTRAREAVTLQINTLKQLERVAGNSMSTSELGYAYTRLAMIEESAGSLEEEHSALVQAREWFKRANPGHELTDQQLKNSLERLDQAFDHLETHGGG